MKKLQKSSELLWIFGIVFVALGVAICSKANLGVSMIAAPAFIIFEALAPFWSGFSVGMMEYVIQGLMLILLCVIIRKFNWRFLIAFLVAVIYGYVLNFFLWVFSKVSFNEIWLRWVMLIVGDVITAFGVACYFKTYMPKQVYELFVAEIATTFNLTITKVKSIFDASLLLLSGVLAFTLFGDVTSFPDLTKRDDRARAVEFGEAIAQLVERKVDRAGNRSGGKLRRRSNVEKERVFRKRVRINGAG